MRFTNVRGMHIDTASLHTKHLYGNKMLLPS